MPTLATLKETPALTAGLPIFTFFLLVVDLVTSHSLLEMFSLYPGAILAFDLNRLSFYLLFHKDIIHWALNIFALWTPLSIYERTHGTVNTGITLNLLAVVTGLQFSLVGYFLFPEMHVVGLSGVVFLFLAFTAYKEHFLTPVIYTLRVQGREVLIPTLYSPLLFVIVCAILLPASSIWGHLFGVFAGYLLGMDRLAFMFPPLKVVLWIEDKLSGAIGLLDGLVLFIREVDAVSIRGFSYAPIFSADPEAN